MFKDTAGKYSDPSVVLQARILWKVLSNVSGNITSLLWFRPALNLLRTTQQPTHQQQKHPVLNFKGSLPFSQALL